MSDATSKPTEQQTPPPTPAPTQQQTPPADAGKEPPVDYKTKYEEAIAHSRDWEKRAKANKAASDELEKLKESQKTEEQKQADRLAALEKENAAFKLREDQAKWAADASKESGVPANLLRGSTQEEIEAHAEELKPHFAKTEQENDPSTDPNAALAAAFGKSPAGAPTSTPELIKAAEKAGDHALVASLKASMLGTVN